MKKIITKLGLKAFFVLCIGIFFITAGLILNFSIKQTTITNDKIVKMATGDYFSLRLNNISIPHGDTAAINVKLEDVNINSGDGGLGVIYFKLDYDKSVFSNVQLSSSIATVTMNESTGEVIATVNNGVPIKSATDLMTISLKSNTTSTKDKSTIKLTDIVGSSGQKISASAVSGTVTFSSATPGETTDDSDSSIVTFRNNGNSNYSASAATVVTVTAADIKSIKYKWQEGTTVPSNNEFQSTLNSGDNVSKEGVTGDYYLWVLVTLNSGNNIRAKSKVFKLDNKNPTVPKITSTDSTSNVEVGHDVHLIISGSGALSGIKKYEYSFNNGATWNQYQPTGIVITDEGVTEVIARAVSNTDRVSNSSSKYIVNIKKEEMKLTYRVSNTEKTNQNVTVWINSNTKLVAPSGWTLSSDGYGISKVYSANQTENVNITDQNGSSDSIQVKIENIDKTKPTVSASYDKKENYVEVTLTSNEELAELPGWSLLNEGKTLKKVYYNNTQEQITAYDLAGNPSDPLQIDITAIEEGNFNFTVNYEENVSSNSIKVTITSDTALNNLSGWEISTDKKILTKVYTGNVSDNITITTMDNQKKNILLKHYFKPEDEETLYVEYSNTELTNESVVVTIIAEDEIEKLEGWTLNSDGISVSKVFNTNTSQKVILSYKDGSTQKANIVINNIDKDKPIIKEAVNHGVYQSLRLDFSEDVEKVTIEKNGKIIEYTKDMTLTEEGSYKITLIDKAGNEVVYDIAIESNIQLVAVPDTKINYTKILIILGILEILIGLLYIFKFKINNKVNIFLVILVLVFTKSNSSIASTDALTANGYVIKNSFLYNVEATTTTSDLKRNLFDDSSLSITKKSSSSYISTGDTVKYKSTPYNIIVAGDVDKDGKITSKDNTNMVNHLISKSIITEVNSKNALDYNTDNVVDINDLYYVNKRVRRNDYIIEPKGVVVNSSNLSVNAGHSAEIKATVYPVNAAKKTLNYSIISGGSYLSISNNKIVGKNKGTGKVRVSIGNVYQDLSCTVNNSYKLHVIDFPDADAMVLEANGHYGMIDTGVATINGDKYAGYKKVDDYLLRIMDGKRKQLDFIILTHAHSDHMGNATKIIEHYGTKSLYAKRYSGQDDVAMSSDRVSNQYSEIIGAAVNKGADINEYGITDDTSQISGRNTNSNKTVISLDAFTIKLHNISNEMEITGVVDSDTKTSENLNSLTQSITITVGGKTLRTYLEGDLTHTNFERSIPKGVINNGHLTDRKTASVKAIVMWQAYDYLKLKDNKLDVYKPAHHSYFNGAQYNEIKTLRPRYIFSTASQKVIYGKDNGNKTLCTVYAAKKFLNDNNGTFASRFRSSDKPIIYDYSTGSIKVSGGLAWDEDKYPFTSSKVDTTFKACGNLDIE